MGVPTAVVCCLIAGIVIALIFVVAFFLELWLRKIREHQKKKMKKMMKI